MSIFSYHILSLPFSSALQMMFCPLKKAKGLMHAETMSAMELGSSIFARTRFFNTTLVVFAQWEKEDDLDFFLSEHSIGQKLAKHWFIKLRFLRQWGTISGFQIPNKTFEVDPDKEKVVAVTLARMKMSQIPRFLKWGKPVETLVRDHPETTLSLASIRLPNLISTFSIWNSQNAMTDMVRGHSAMPRPKRHIDAMKERERKDFHVEFTTLRFAIISEHEGWKEKSAK